MIKKIAVLTSSRADYGIYKPLLKAISNDKSFDLTIIAFGMHLLDKYGKTVDEIVLDGYGEIMTVPGLLDGDNKLDIVCSYAKVIEEFGPFWDSRVFDLVFALGDRYEMSAAVQASIPFGIKIAHLFGGETTLGAFDNIYRHQISLASKIHFVSTSTFASRVNDLIGSPKNIYNIGSISLDEIKESDIPDIQQLSTNFSVPLNKPYVLVTFHPETINPDRNRVYSEIIEESLKVISKDLDVVITLSNADTYSSLYRDKFIQLKKLYPDSYTLVENFGRENYFSAMKHSSYLLGNTSSGIVEAASFKKYVLNVGDRQKGRLSSSNVINVPFDANQILENHLKVLKKGDYNGENIYYKKDSVLNIIKIINEKF